jgi:hypothetical protein
VKLQLSFFFFFFGIFNLTGQIDYFPPQRANMDDATYSDNINKLKYFYSAVKKEHWEGKKLTRYHISIAITYKILDEPNDSIFYHIKESLKADSLDACFTLKSMVEVDKHLKGRYRPYDIRGRDTMLYDSILCKCLPILIKDSLAKQVKFVQNSDNYYPTLLNELKEIYKDDQKYRSEINEVQDKNGKDSPEAKLLWNKQNLLDSLNLIKAERIINQYGYPGNKLASEEYHNVIYFVILHSSLKIQEKYFPIILESVKKGDFPKGEIAYLIDRIHVQKHDKQIFGTQQVWNKLSGKLETAPLEDKETIDALLKEWGLQ